MKEMECYILIKFRKYSLQLALSLMTKKINTTSSHCFLINYLLPVCKKHVINIDYFYILILSQFLSKILLANKIFFLIHLHYFIYKGTLVPVAHHFVQNPLDKSNFIDLMSRLSFLQKHFSCSLLKILPKILSTNQIIFSVCNFSHI